MYSFIVFLENHKNEYNVISVRKATFIKVARASLLLFFQVNYCFYVYLREGKLTV